MLETYSYDSLVYIMYYALYNLQEMNRNSRNGHEKEQKQTSLRHSAQIPRAQKTNVKIFPPCVSPIYVFARRRAQYLHGIIACR